MRTRSLDLPATYGELDPTGIGSRFLSLPAQVHAGWGLGSVFAAQPLPDKTKRVLVAGMGGSGIGGQLVRGLVDSRPGSVQVVPWREYRLPGWASSDTLLIAVSISGNTDETISMFRSAGEMGLPRAAISGRGRLLTVAEEEGVPVAVVGWDHEPRAALGYTFVSLYRAMVEYGLTTGLSADIDAACDALEEVAAQLDPATPVVENIAKQIALEIEGRYPVIASANPLLGVAARWKSQINENADCWAAMDAIPEMKHNTVQGIHLAPDWPSGPYVVALQPEPCDPNLERDFEAILSELSASHVPNLVLKIEGPNEIGRMLIGSLMGDMVSYYLAILRERPPASTEVLNRVKSQCEPRQEKS